MTGWFKNLRSLICRIKPKIEDSDPLKNRKSQVKSKRKKHTNNYSLTCDIVVKRKMKTHNKAHVQCECHNNNRQGCGRKNAGSKSSTKRKHGKSSCCCSNHIDYTQTLSNSPGARSQCDSYSNLSGASIKTSQTFEKYNRFPNNPLRQEISMLNKQVTNPITYPATVRRWPSSAAVESGYRINADMNRFHTPPNRSILSNDGIRVASVYRGEYFVQTEPDAFTPSRPCDPPQYSPRIGSERGSTMGLDHCSSNSVSVTLLSKRSNSPSNVNEDPPPEYSEPPSYYAVTKCVQSV